MQSRDYDPVRDGCPRDVHSGKAARLPATSGARFYAGRTGSHRWRACVDRFLFAQLLKSAVTITTLGHKQMDADSQARQLLDRMAIDFAQMVKRSDVDYYVKSIAPSVWAYSATTRKRSDSVLQHGAGLLSQIELSKPTFARCLSSKFELHFLFV